MEDVGRRSGRCRNLPRIAVEDVDPLIRIYYFKEILLKIHVFQAKVWKVFTSSTASSNVFHESISFFTT